MSFPSSKFEKEMMCMFHLDKNQAIFTFTINRVRVVQSHIIYPRFFLKEIDIHGEAKILLYLKISRSTSHRKFRSYGLQG